MITLYTDGSSQGNPGPGGYAAILIYDGHTKELVGAYQKTTNNRMELMAVIVGLESIKKMGQQVKVYSDSRYIVDAVNRGWLRGWLNRGFVQKKKRIKNKDLWLRFWQVYQAHEVELGWIEGHAGHVGNERCDFLAVQAAQKGPWQEDVGYMQENRLQFKLF
ncbi:MAG: ribonuclease HI [Bacteroidota bacterium]